MRLHCTQHGNIISQCNLISLNVEVNKYFSYFENYDVGKGFVSGVLNMHENNNSILPSQLLFKCIVWLREAAAD